jgi:hypothetical protein
LHLAPESTLDDLRPYTNATLTLDYKSKYIITSATVNISFQGKSYLYVTRLFNAAYHGPGIIADTGFNFLEQMTIPPNETREFDISTTFNAPVSTKLSWYFVEITGIAP